MGVEFGDADVVERITAEIMSINAELAGMDGRRRELMDRCESLIAVQKNLSALLLKMQGL